MQQNYLFGSFLFYILGKSLTCFYAQQINRLKSMTMISLRYTVDKEIQRIRWMQPIISKEIYENYEKMY